MSGLRLGLGVWLVLYTAKGLGFGAIPAIDSIPRIVRLVDVPLHSRALTPNRDVKNESGRKLVVIS